MSFFFFFQAEDGIRDDLVTGVQTCALPICFDLGLDSEDSKAYIFQPDSIEKATEIAVKFAA